MAAMCLVHLEEESTEREEEDETKDPDGINGVTEEFMVHLAWAVKDTQVEEKCCYHCGSPKHFIHDCPLVRASKENMQLNHKEEMAWEEGSLDPSDENDNTKEPPRGGSQGVILPKQTHFLNLDPFQHWYRVKNVAKVKIMGKAARLSWTMVHKSIPSHLIK